jgi:hypothetical protein
MGKRSTRAPSRPPAGSPRKTQVELRAIARQARRPQRAPEPKRPPRARQLQLPSFDPWPVLRRVPRAGWLCALVAILNAVSWSLVTPPFQAPDEQDHFAYVKQLAETGKLPTSGVEAYSSEETAALTVLKYGSVRLGPASKTISTEAEQRTLEKQLELGNRLPKNGSRGVGVAISEPPLYYALETIPYDLASDGTLLDRLQLMRLFSALWAGVTALFAFLFLREALPRERWAWTVGALGVALSPLFGFMSGAVNPDSMLFAVSAALLYCVARGFRRGLTTASAIATGLVIAVGFLTKLNFVGIAPSAFLALGILAVRGARRSRSPRGSAASRCCWRSSSPSVPPPRSPVARPGPPTARCSPD